ncbi:MAG: DUF92 domain-containing protein [Chitinophagaceae bacterium]
MDFQFYLVMVSLALAAVASVWLQKLTAAAGITGVITAMLIYLGCGITGLAMLAAFFIIGTTATSFKIKQKQHLKIAEENKGKRNAGQVLANAGLAAGLGLVAWTFPQYSVVCSLLITAGFSSATADTLSSELGNVYGKKYYNILSLRKDTRGLNGVISLEGTLCGFAGSVLIAVIYALGFGFHVRPSLMIIIAGTAGNLFDSLLGATIERKGIIGNNKVNFLNTLFAAVIALLLNLI